jgi:hypothetical protein
MARGKGRRPKTTQELMNEYWERQESGGHFETYNSSRSGQTGQAQTDLYFGEKGDKGGHIAVNESGDIEHVRDSDGEVLYDRYDPDQPYE